MGAAGPALHGARVKSVASAGPGQPSQAAGPLSGATPGTIRAATPGALCLTGSTIRRDLVLRDTALVNSTGPALAADRARIGGSALLDPGFLAHGDRPDGAVRLARAEIGGDLRLSGARLASRTGPALLADGLTVHGDLMLAQAAAPGLPFTATGAGEVGTILLRGCTVGGSLSLDGAVVEHGGPAARRQPARRRVAGRSESRRPVSASAGKSPPASRPGWPGSPASCAAASRTAARSWDSPRRWARCAWMAARSAAGLVLGRALLRGHTGPALRAGRLVARSGVAAARRPASG